MAATSLIKSINDPDLVISIDHVGKMYKLYDKPVDRLKDTLLWRFGKIIGREFWALQDITFQVRKGETIGILGRNGSGKSTLLQIIAGVLQPTSGQTFVRGRVSALLELGSGFNPEFTGKENIFMNGAVLGLSEEEIRAQYDEIVNFADIGEFIDQPVKFYSSGMFARLAFAIGINVSPDLFIIDEALSVGDIFFQAKCFAKLEEYRDSGGTILFVTHDTYTLQRICTRAIVLDHGKMIFEGDSAEATNTYYKLEHGTIMVPMQEVKSSISTAPETLDVESALFNLEKVNLASGKVELRRDFTTGDGTALIEEVFIFNDRNEPTTLFSVGEWMTVYVKVIFYRHLEELSFGVGMRDKTGVLIGGAHNWYTGNPLKNVHENSIYLFSIRIKLDIAPGIYLLVIGAARDYTFGAWEDYGVLWDCCSIKIVGTPKFWGQSFLQHHIEYKVL